MSPVIKFNNLVIFYQYLIKSNLKQVVTSDVYYINILHPFNDQQKNLLTLLKLNKKIQYVSSVKRRFV